MNYDSLYIDILKAGIGNVEGGLSYNELKDILIKQGYSLENDCVELAVKRWFYDSFHHIGTDGKLIDFYDLENHLNCNFVMEGEACLKYVEHKTLKSNLLIAVIAAVLSAIAIFVSFL